jgi:magnesium transporter
MPDTVSQRESRADVHDVLAEITALLRKHELVEHLAQQQPGERRELVESLVYRQHLAELAGKLEPLHPADIAYILEALPLDERLLVWDMIKSSEREGEILLEVSDSVRESLIATMRTEELVAAAETLEADEIADLAPDLPEEVMAGVYRSLSLEEREQLRSAMSFPDDAVGALMDFEMVTVRADVTLETVLRYLRRWDELPDQTDQIFVVDRSENLLGALPFNKLLVNDVERTVQEVMVQPGVILHERDKADEAAAAFERYDLVSAPVIDYAGKLVGRVTVNEVLDFVRDRAEEELRAQAGLSEEEDVFSSVWKSVQNRWAWLAINLCTAFLASRVIGAFEGSIGKLVALAALMPIVAGIGGNSGNQTITMIVRAVALGQITTANARQLLLKEIGVAVVNGLVWGGIIGLVAVSLYKSWALGAVMVAAMTLNLVLAACMGVAIPMLMMRLGRDPAMGSSVMITACTDSGGFFIFLGLATLFLM